MSNLKEQYADYQEQGLDPHMAMRLAMSDKTATQEREQPKMKRQEERRK